MANIKKIQSDDQKHNQADSADEEIKGEQSPLGSASGGEAEDIDKTQSSVGLQNDDKGPQELNSEEVIEEANKHH